jgi:hypothetical protein
MEILTKMNGCRRLSAIGPLLIVMALIATAGAGQSAEEYEVKAAFIYNFTKFVEWPATAEAPSFTICILGDDPFKSSIDRLTSGKMVGSRPVQVRRLKEGVEGRQCQIVFVGASERAKASRLVEAVRGTSVLTVGESVEFLRVGGMFYLSMADNHVNVVINSAATEAARLQVSAKLMTLAKVYKP